MVTTVVHDDGVPTVDPHVASGTTFHWCVTTPKSATTALVATLTYGGVGEDVPSALGGYALWENNRYDELETSH